MKPEIINTYRHKTKDETIQTKRLGMGRVKIFFPDGTTDNKSIGFLKQYQFVDSNNPQVASIGKNAKRNVVGRVRRAV